VFLVELVFPEQLIPGARAVDAERIDDYPGLVTLDDQAKQTNGPLAQGANLEAMRRVGNAKRRVAGRLLRGARGNAAHLSAVDQNVHVAAAGMLPIVQLEQARGSAVLSLLHRVHGPE